MNKINYKLSDVHGQCCRAVNHDMNVDKMGKLLIIQLLKKQQQQQNQHHRVTNLQFLDDHLQKYVSNVGSECPCVLKEHRSEAQTQIYFFSFTSVTCVCDSLLSVKDASHRTTVMDTANTAVLSLPGWGKCGRPIEYYMADSQFKSSVEN